MKKAGFIGRSGWCGRRHPHGHALGDAVRRIQDHPIGGVQSGEHFHAVAKIAAELDGAQVEPCYPAPTTAACMPWARKIRALSESVSTLARGVFIEAHLGIAAGENIAVRVGHLQFHLEGARSRVHRAGRPGDRGLQIPGPAIS